MRLRRLPGVQCQPGVFSEGFPFANSGFPGTDVGFPVPG
jgi:hypothetical protein